MYYVVNENKEQVELREALDNLVISTESVSAAKLTLTLDGIECYGINGSVNKTTYASGRVVYSGTGNAIFVDKNHDLSYYVNGSDWVDSSNYNTHPGTFGYEWGGYNTTTGVTATAAGTGLSNTNSLISMNLRPSTSGWYVVWDKIKEFRESHSDNWFLPSKDELNLIYVARANLSNLSTAEYYYYWSSSEYSSTDAWRQFFDTRGSQSGLDKNRNSHRSRLCRQY